MVTITFTGSPIEVLEEMAAFHVAPQTLTVDPRAMPVTTESLKQAVPEKLLKIEDTTAKVERKTKATKPAAETAPTPIETEAPKYATHLEEIQATVPALLARPEADAMKMREKIVALLAKYGAKKGSEIAVDKQEAFLTEVRAL